VVCGLLGCGSIPRRLPLTGLYGLTTQAITVDNERSGCGVFKGVISVYALKKCFIEPQHCYRPRFEPDTAVLTWLMCLLIKPRTV
jgi:hypothetical protein